MKAPPQSHSFNDSRNPCCGELQLLPLRDDSCCSPPAPTFTTKISKLGCCVKQGAQLRSAASARPDNKAGGKQPHSQCLKELSSVLCFIQFMLCAWMRRRRRSKRSSHECHSGEVYARSAGPSVIKSPRHPCLLFTSTQKLLKRSPCWHHRTSTLCPGVPAASPPLPLPHKGSANPACTIQRCWRT